MHNWGGLGEQGVFPLMGQPWTKGYMQHVVLFAWVWGYI